MSIKEQLFQVAMNQTKKQNNLEEQIAREWYGKSFDELDYDDKELVSYEAIDRM